jgi:hypothetical protein
MTQASHSPNAGDQNAINNSSNVSVKNNSDNFSQNVGPNNNAPIVGVANSPGAHIDVGITQDDIEIIRDGMKAAEKRNETILDRFFGEGYVVFSATKGNQIVPLPLSPGNDFSINDWKDCYVGYGDNNIKVSPPAISYHTNLVYGNTTYLPAPVVMGFAYSLHYGVPGPNPENPKKVYVVFLDTNADSLTVAVGIH